MLKDDRVACAHFDVRDALAADFNELLLVFCR
jgi:hypothetical protein